jgi:hypothetical protein
MLNEHTLIWDCIQNYGGHRFLAGWLVTGLGRWRDVVNLTPGLKYAFAEASFWHQERVLRNSKSGRCIPKEAIFNNIYA